MKIERFEDIQGWQEARTLTKKIYELTNKIYPLREIGALQSDSRSLGINNGQHCRRF